VKKDLLYPFLLKYSLLPSLSLWRAEEARLFSELELEEPVLDLGCGNGFFTSVALNKQVKAGCDRDFSQVRRAKLSNAYRFALVADIANLPFKNEGFATIICNCVLEHIERIEQVLPEISRILAPHGAFVFTAPSERFNEWFYLSVLLRKLRLGGLADNQIQRYNRLQFHYNIWPVHRWSDELAKAGLALDEYRYYSPRAVAFVFSALDDIQHAIAGMFRRKLTSSEALATRTGRQLDRDFLQGLLARLWWCLLMPFHRIGLPRNSEGAGVLVRARKTTVMSRLSL
jgi:SAM-dependent methyltransferase